MRAHLCQRRPSHPGNPQKSCKSSFRQSPQSLVNSRHLSSNAHASAPVPTSPLPSRKSPIILQILLQTIRPISRKLSSSLVKHSYKRTCANVALPSRKSPKILQILLQTTRPTQITAHPQYPMTSYKRCYYPLKLKTSLEWGYHWCPLKTYPPQDRELLCYSLSDV